MLRSRRSCASAVALAPAPPPLLLLRHLSSSKPPEMNPPSAAPAHPSPPRVHLSPSSRPPPTPRVHQLCSSAMAASRRRGGAGGGRRRERAGGSTTRESWGDLAAPPLSQRKASGAPAARAPWTGAWSRGAQCLVAGSRSCAVDRGLAMDSRAHASWIGASGSPPHLAAAVIHTRRSTGRTGVRHHAASYRRRIELPVVVPRGSAAGRRRGGRQPPGAGEGVCHRA